MISDLNFHAVSDKEGKLAICSHSHIFYHDAPQLFIKGGNRYVLFCELMQHSAKKVISDMTTEKGIKTPAGKDKWHGSTVKSILTNEKYKGDALLQKSYTADYLEKKDKQNHGEIPMYYVEGSREKLYCLPRWLRTASVKMRG